MSFNFNWSNAFSPSFRESAKTVLETALNKGNTPALIVGKIEVRELDMGVIVSCRCHQREGGREGGEEGRERAELREELGRTRTTSNRASKESTIRVSHAWSYCTITLELTDLLVSLL
jgi:hypothetical protein